MLYLRNLAFVAGAILSVAASSLGQSWQPLTHQPNFTAGTALLLTDGTVLVHREASNSGFSEWYKLTPDINGSYVNGTWSQVASLPPGYGPLWFASAVLADGRVIVEGGELNFTQMIWTNKGAIYDPLANTWTPVSPPNTWANIGDAQSAVLFDKRFMVANAVSRQQAILDPATLTWTLRGAGKFDLNDEEGWTLLPNGKLLTVDAYVDRFDPNGMNSELYDPATSAWSSAGSTIVQLWDPHGTYEIGPAMLRPDGTVFATGANTAGAGHTAIYNVSAGTWTPGPDFPGNFNVADGPAALLPNGNVLIAASPGYTLPPTEFFEWDGHSLNQVPATPRSPNDSSLLGRMLLLPTGQVLYTDASNDVEIYTHTANPYPGLAPAAIVTTAVLSRGSSFRLSGFRFNGASQAVAFGDDAQAATNYPLVRITNASTGHVFYCRTHDHSTMAVGYNGPAYTHVDVPANMETGQSYLEVVVNGIASPRYMIGVR